MFLKPIVLLEENIWFSSEYKTQEKKHGLPW